MTLRSEGWSPPPSSSRVTCPVHHRWVKQGEAVRRCPECPSDPFARLVDWVDEKVKQGQSRGLSEAEISDGILSLVRKATHSPTPTEKEK